MAASKTPRKASASVEPSTTARGKAVAASRTKAASKAQTTGSKSLVKGVTKTPQRKRNPKRGESDRVYQEVKRRTKRIEEIKRNESEPAPKPYNNGRYKGRKLIRWSPFHDQALLLCIQYECYENKIELPWDKIATRLAGERDSTKMCIIQHLNKLRASMLNQGRFVTPLMGRKDNTRSGNVRGNAKCGIDENGNAVYREVRWNEDLTFLFDPKDIDPTVHVSRGIHKLSSPVTLQRDYTEINDMDRITGTLSGPGGRIKKPRAAKAKANAKAHKTDSDRESNESYTPCKAGKRATRAPTKSHENPESDYDDRGDQQSEDSDEEESAAESHEVEDQLGEDLQSRVLLFDDNEQIQAERSKVIVLKLPALRKLADDGNAQSIDTQQEDSEQISGDLPVGSPGSSGAETPDLSGDCFSVAASVPYKPVAVGHENCSNKDVSMSDFVKESNNIDPFTNNFGDKTYNQVVRGATESNGSHGYDVQLLGNYLVNQRAVVPLAELSVGPENTALPHQYDLNNMFGMNGSAGLGFDFHMPGSAGLDPDFQMFHSNAYRNMPPHMFGNTFTRYNLHSPDIDGFGNTIDNGMIAPDGFQFDFNGFDNTIDNGIAALSGSGNLFNQGIDHGAELGPYSALLAQSPLLNNNAFNIHDMSNVTFDNGDLSDDTFHNDDDFVDGNLINESYIDDNFIRDGFVEDSFHPGLVSGN